MEELLSWFELNTLGFSFIAFAITTWCLFLSMYLRRKKGEDNIPAFLLSMLGLFVGFLALPVIIIIGIPVHYIIKYMGELRYREGREAGEKLGYTFGKADERRSHGWDD